MSRLRVEHAEPGTDPTLIETPMVTRGGGSEFLRKNWWIPLAIIALVVLPRVTGDRKKPENTTKKQEVAAVQATATPAPGLPAGWCESPGGFAVPPGEYVYGSEQRVCEAGVDTALEEAP
jgi:hypothetical protein